MVGKLAFFTLAFVLPLALSVSLFAAEIAVPLFGPGFAPTADALRILIWYALVSMIANVFAQALMVQNRQRSLLGIRAAGLAGNIALNLVLIPRLGVAGAALASLTAESVVLVALLAIFRENGWEPARTLPRVARTLAAGVLAALVALALRPAGLVIGIGGGLAAYGAGVWLLRALAADDLDLLYRLAAAMPGGALVRRVWRRDTPINW
jgi:O-antigen/teichoic acid export membrane protein